ncbi:4618_t:CDS:1, partial [Acaulospora colombiana]
MNTTPPYSYWDSPLQVSAYDNTYQNSSNYMYAPDSGAGTGMSGTQYGNFGVNYGNQYLQPPYANLPYGFVQTFDSTSPALLPDQNSCAVPLVAPPNNELWKGTFDTPEIALVNLPNNGVSP